MAFMIKIPFEIKLSSREKLFGVVISCALVYGLFDVLLYSPKTREEAKLRDEIQKVDSRILENYALIANPENLSLEIGGYEKKVRFCEDHLAKQTQPGRLLEELAKLCKAMSIEIMSLSPRETTLAPLAFKQMLVTMDLRCDLITIARFMGALKTLPFAVFMETMEILRESGQGKLKCHVVLTTFFPVQQGQ